jgi:hypothetical protein
MPFPSGHLIFRRRGTRACKVIKQSIAPSTKLCSLFKTSVSASPLITSAHTPCGRHPCPPRFPRTRVHSADLYGTPPTQLSRVLKLCMTNVASQWIDNEGVSQCWYLSATIFLPPSVLRKNECMHAAEAGHELEAFSSWGRTGKTVRHGLLWRGRAAVICEVPAGERGIQQRVGVGKR